MFEIEEMSSVNIQRDSFHGELNSTISPIASQDNIFMEKAAKYLAVCCGDESGLARRAINGPC